MKKVLIITYYWPPAGGPGVQRVLKFAKYLPEFGWEPVILTVVNGEYPALDPDLEKDVAQSVKVFRTKIYEPHRMYKFFIGKPVDTPIPTHILNPSENDNFKSKISKWIRANFFIPDAKIGWMPSALKAGRAIIDSQDIDLIFSTSPPHTVQIIARKLALRSRIKWVADFRDPWIEAFWQRNMYQSKIASRININLQKTVLKSADSITTANSNLIDSFEKIIQNKYYFIPNGFDPDDFKNLSKSPSNKFRITYIGTLGRDQNIDNFLSSVQALSDKNTNKIEISFYGNIHESIIRSIENMKLGNKINIHSYISHNEVLKTMLDSEILLLVIPDSPDNKGIIPGKFFEYMASGNYILALGPGDGGVAKILKETNSGKMFGYKSDLTTILNFRFEQWSQHKMSETNSKKVVKYSRKYETQQLADIFEKVLG